MKTQSRTVTLPIEPSWIKRNPINNSKIVFNAPIGSIRKSADYSDFNFINVNRAVNRNTKTYKNLYAEIGDDQSMLGGIGIVDRYGNVIEGQHRLDICKRLNIDFEFKIGRNANLTQIKRINNNQTKWNFKTTLFSEIAAQNPNYIKYQEFWEKTKAMFPNAKDLTHNVRKMFLSQKQENKGWNQGQYKIGNPLKAISIFKKYDPVRKYFKGRQQEFAKAFMKAVLTNEYNQDRFLRSLVRYVIDIEATKGNFTASLGYQTLDNPQTANECHKLINTIWNYKQPPSLHTNLLPTT